MKNYTLFAFGIVVIQLIACQERDARFEDFDTNTLPILKKFQTEMLKNDSIVQIKRKKNDSYGFLHASNFNETLPFLSEKLRKEMFDIYSKKKIGSIDYNRNCITFSIKKIGNSLLDDEWLELDLVYHDKKNKEFEPCLSRSFFSKTDSLNIKQIDDSWFLILTKQRRYLKG